MIWIKKKDKDGKYTYKSIYTFVSSNFEARTTFLFNELFYSTKSLEDK